MFCFIFVSLVTIAMNTFLDHLFYLYFKTCYHCHGEIDDGDLVVFAPKIGKDVCWHPACFVCTDCEELLVDLVYGCHGKQLLCERHYAEKIRPRCPACDEVSSLMSI